MRKTTRRELMVGAAVSALTASAQQPVAAGSPLTLWDRKPASKWESEALPIGNGSLGAMVFGQVEHERLQLNEHSLWSGHPEVLDGPQTLEALPKVRQLLFEGKYSEAQEMASREMMLHPRATPASYQTLGDLLLDFTHGDQVAGYRRSLDLDTGIARVEYTVFGVKHTREVFALRAGGGSGPQALVMRIAADKAGALTFGVRLAREENATVAYDGVRATMRGQARNDGVLFAAELAVRVEGGRVRKLDDGLQVERSTEATLWLMAATNYQLDAPAFKGADPVETCRRRAAAVAAMTWQAARDTHVAEHRRLFRRVELNLGGEDLSGKPTHERPAGMEAGGEDPQVFGTYFLKRREPLLFRFP